MGKLSKLKAACTVCLTVFDMGSDIVLAVDYYQTGEDWWWFALTLTFFLLPVLVLAVIGFFMLYQRRLIPDSLKYWKAFECMAESGPQLILQLYIMALPDVASLTETEENHSTFIANTTVQLFSDIYKTTKSNFSINVTEQPVVSLSNDSDISLTLILQVMSVITSLLSISWGATSYKVINDEENGNLSFETMDYALDVTWNILCISARILALSLFATIYRYWFAGIVTVHITIIFFIVFFIFICADKTAWLLGVISGLGIGVTLLFNVFLLGGEKYIAFLFYWVIIMIETVIIISVWYVDTPDKNLWYHNAAIAYVIPAYFVSVFIKTFHLSTFESNKGKPIWKWDGSKMCVEAQPQWEENRRAIAAIMLN